MAWIKLDDGFSENTKVLSVSAAALRLHLFGLCYAARNETDGKIPPAALPALGGTKELVDELVMWRLWHQRTAGWAINDFLDYNPSARDLKRRRKDAQERMSALRNGSHGRPK